jgi:hypothetical protein
LEELIHSPNRFITLYQQYFAKDIQSLRLPFPIHPDRLNTISRSSLFGTLLRSTYNLQSPNALLAYRCNQGFVVLDQEGNYLLFRTERHSTPVLLSFLELIPLAECDASEEKMAKYLEAIFVERYEAHRDMDRAFQDYNRQFIQPQIEVVMERKGSIDRFRNWLYLLEMAGFMLWDLKALTAPRARYLMGTNGNANVCYADSMTLFSTTNRYSAWPGKEELITVNGVGNIRLWTDGCVQIPQSNHLSPAFSMDKKLAHSFVTGILSAAQPESVRDCLWLNYKFWQTIGNIDIEDGEGAFQQAFHGTVENEDRFLLPDLVPLMKTATRGTSTQFILVHGLHLPFAGFNTSYHGKKTRPNLISSTALALANVQAFEMIGTVSQIFVRDALVLKTDTHVSLYFPEHGEPSRYRAITGHQWHDPFPGRMRRRSSLATGTLWNGKSYFRDEPWFAVNDSIRQLVVEEVSRSKNITKWFPGRIADANADSVLTGWKKVWTEPIPTSVTTASRSPQVPGVKQYVAPFNSLLGIHVRAQSLVVGTTPWDFHVFPSSREYLQLLFQTEDNVIVEPDSEWHDTNHQVRYNNEDLVFVQISEHWYCYSGFGKNPRERGNAAMRDSQTIAIHDSRLWSREQYKEFMEGTMVYHFTEASVVGYFRLQDFVSDLDRSHFFDLFVPCLIEQDLVLTGPNDYIVVGGFGDPANWDSETKTFRPDPARREIFHHRVIDATEQWKVTFNGELVDGSQQSTPKGGKGDGRSHSSFSPMAASTVRPRSSLDPNRGKAEEKKEQQEEEEEEQNPRRRPPIPNKPFEHAIVPEQEVPPVVWKLARLSPKAPGEPYTATEVKSWPFCIVKMILPDDAEFVRPFAKNCTKRGLEGKCRVDKAYVWEIQRYNFQEDPMGKVEEEHGKETEPYEGQFAVSAFCDELHNILEYHPKTMVTLKEDEVLNTSKAAHCAAGIHVYAERHHVVMMTGHAFGSEVSPLEFIRAMLFSRQAEHIRMRNLYAYAIEEANLANVALQASAPLPMAETVAEEETG